MQRKSERWHLLTRGIRILLIVEAVSTKKAARKDLEEVWEHPWVTRGRLDATLSGHRDLGILMVIRERITWCPRKGTPLDLWRGCSNTGQEPVCAARCRISVQW